MGCLGVICIEQHNVLASVGVEHTTRHDNSESNSPGERRAPTHANRGMEDNYIYASNARTSALLLIEEGKGAGMKIMAVK
jgi:hypothetical protein